ncbi:MAG: PD-(D/E)XK nuclease family protein [Burkholderiaceae bacterium]|jgi:CRISPR/Cas system-associated exonuclease Cas4 (RecB family)|nr:PD-(D/E)XK nuclease family protein [Burkholderiaceae bacterium]
MTLIVVIGLIGVALLLAAVWVRRRPTGERASRPRELAGAELVYMEKLFRIQEPFRLVARVDRAYRMAKGTLVLVELKTRAHGRAYPSDTIQLSAQRLAIERQTGEPVEPYAYVSVPGTTTRPGWRFFRVHLLDEQQVIALARRRDQLLTGDARPGYAASERACAGCALQNKCDRTEHSVSAGLMTAPQGLELTQATLNCRWWIPADWQLRSDCSPSPSRVACPLSSS